MIDWERWMVVSPSGSVDELLAEDALSRGWFETVGAVEAELLLKAKNSKTQTLCLRHDRGSNRQRMAARRLVARGLLAAPNCMTAGFPGGGLYFYALTSRGASCWLRYPKPKKEQS